MPSPCFDCSEVVRSGPPSPVYQPSPPPQAQTREVCVLLPDESTQKGFLTQFWVQVPSSDCPSNVCMQPCGNSILTDLAGNDLAGQIIDCDIADTTPPQVPGAELVCADAAGTWTSPPCATQIRIDVTQADATGPTLTIGAQTQILQVGLYEWNAPAGAVIDSMTLTNDSLNQCSNITWLQSGTVSTPEEWVLSTNTAGTVGGSLAASPASYTGPQVFNSLLFFPTNAGIRSYDSATMTWSTPLAGDVRSLRKSTDGLTLYAGVAPNSVYTSTDGTTWNLHSTVTGETSIGNIMDCGGDLYTHSFATTGDVWHYNGATWDEISAGSTIGALQIWGMESYNGFLYIGANRNPGAGNRDKIDLYEHATTSWSTTIPYTPNVRVYAMPFAFNGDIYASLQQDEGGTPAILVRRTGAGAWSTLEVDATGVPNTITQFFTDGTKLMGAAGWGWTANSNVYEWNDGAGQWDSVPGGFQPGQTNVTGVAYYNSTYWAIGGSGFGAPQDIRYYQAAIAGSCT